MPHRSEYWLIPPKDNTEFVYRMETILSLYEEPDDETRPGICSDESSKELRKQSATRSRQHREQSLEPIITTYGTANACFTWRLNR